MLLVSGSALVAGSTAPPMITQYVRVERAFYHDKVVQPVGAVIEVPKHIAASLINARKASAAEKPAPAIPEPPAAPELAPKPRGKKSHAQ